LAIGRQVLWKCSKSVIFWLFAITAVLPAAQFSYISQPSLTQSIKKLEDELGGELFTRDRSGCLLTSLGRLVEPNFRKIYKETVATKADAIRFTQLNTIPLRIGLMATIGAQRLEAHTA
jgi:DNA-binding transcriptional LysR family regulator